MAAQKLTFEDVLGKIEEYQDQLVKFAKERYGDQFADIFGSDPKNTTHQLLDTDSPNITIIKTQLGSTHIARGLVSHLENKGFSEDSKAGNFSLFRALGSKLSTVKNYGSRFRATMREILADNANDITPEDKKLTYQITKAGYQYCHDNIKHPMSFVDYNSSAGSALNQAMILSRKYFSAQLEVTRSETDLVDIEATLTDFISILETNENPDETNTKNFIDMYNLFNTQYQDAIVKMEAVHLFVNEMTGHNRIVPESVSSCKTKMDQIEKKLQQFSPFSTLESYHSDVDSIIKNIRSEEIEQHEDMLDKMINHAVNEIVAIEKEVDLKTQEIMASFIESIDANDRTEVSKLIKQNTEALQEQMSTLQNSIKTDATLELINDALKQLEHSSVIELPFSAKDLPSLVEISGLPPKSISDFLNAQDAYQKSWATLSYYEQATRTAAYTAGYYTEKEEILIANKEQLKNALNDQIEEQKLKLDTSKQIAAVIDCKNKVAASTKALYDRLSTVKNWQEKHEEIGAKLAGAKAQSPTFAHQDKAPEQKNNKAAPVKSRKRVFTALRIIALSLLAGCIAAPVAFFGFSMLLIPALIFAASAVLATLILSSSITALFSGKTAPTAEKEASLEENKSEGAPKNDSNGQSHKQIVNALKSSGRPEPQEDLEDSHSEEESSTSEDTESSASSRSSSPVDFTVKLSDRGVNDDLETSISAYRI